MAKPKPDLIQIEREQAWVGDAVLGLYAREWILQREGSMDAEMFARMTSNHFLAAFGNPTSVEAEIGRVYAKDGLQAARSHIETVLIPLFLVQEQKRKRQAGGRARS
jgi:dsRNA-specific ribonuclease